MAISTDRLCSSLTSNFLHLVLMPTEAYNFRCTYCYEEFRYKRMEPLGAAGGEALSESEGP